jgi:hypothetical protein
VVCHTDEVAAVTVRVRRIASVSGLAVIAVMLSATFGLVGPGTTAAAASLSSTSGPVAPLQAPKTTDAQDTRYFTDTAEADPALASYEQKRQNVALRALLTDGSAFCALLKRAKNLDAALVEEATGARSSEAQTHLPLSVTTFNTIESVALLTLCPSEQTFLPAGVRAKIRTLGKTLASRAG